MRNYLEELGPHGINVAYQQLIDENRRLFDILVEHVGLKRAMELLIKKTREDIEPKTS